MQCLDSNDCVMLDCLPFPRQVGVLLTMLQAK